MLHQNQYFQMHGYFDEYWKRIRYYFPHREIDTLFTYAQFKKPIFDTNKKKYFGGLNNFQMGFDSVADEPKVKVAVKTAF